MYVDRVAAQQKSTQKQFTRAGDINSIKTHQNKDIYFAQRKWEMVDDGCSCNPNDVYKRYPIPKYYIISLLVERKEGH